MKKFTDEEVDRILAVYARNLFRAGYQDACDGLDFSEYCLSPYEIGKKTRLKEIKTRKNKTNI